MCEQMVVVEATPNDAYPFRASLQDLWDDGDWVERDAWGEDHPASALGVLYGTCIISRSTPIVFRGVDPLSIYPLTG